MLADRAGLRRRCRPAPRLACACRRRGRRSGVVVFEATVRCETAPATNGALKLAERARAGRRAFAVEGTGSFGAGLTRFLDRARRAGVRGRPATARTPLGRQDRRARCGPCGPQRAQPTTAGHPACTRRTQSTAGTVAAREGAVNAKRAGLCQLRDLLSRHPEPLRSELRPLTRARLLQRLARNTPAPAPGRRARAARLLALALGRSPRPATHSRGARART